LGRAKGKERRGRGVEAPGTVPLPNGHQGRQAGKTLEKG